MAEPEAVSDDETDSDKRKRLLKGCGCSVALLGLGLGILVIGNFDSGAWASALGAVVIGFLVYNLSGINGFWER